MGFNQYVRFVAIGGVTGLASLVARSVLAWVFGEQTVARYSATVVGACLIAILISFLLNRRFTFGAPGTSTGWNRFPHFVLIALFGVGLTWALSVFLHYFAGLEALFGRYTPTVAFALAAVTSSLATYPLNALLVFRPAEMDEAT